MVVLVLLGAFAGLIYETVITGLRLANASGERDAVRQQLVNAMERLTREASLASAVDVADDQQFQFDADLDADGATEHDINYQVSGGALQRMYGGTTVALAKNLTALEFDYVQAGGSALATPVATQPLRDTIRVVQITMTASQDDETFSFPAAAYLRNH